MRREASKRKYVHFMLQTAALVLIIVGLVAIVLNRQATSAAGTYAPAMWSAHSWVGAIIVVMFTAQVRATCCRPRCVLRARVIARLLFRPKGTGDTADASATPTCAA